MKKQAVLREAEKKGFDVQINPRTGEACIDGLRWDLWFKYHNIESKPMVIPTRSGYKIVRDYV